MEDKAKKTSDDTLEEASTVVDPSKGNPPPSGQSTPPEAELSPGGSNPSPASGGGRSFLKKFRLGRFGGFHNIYFLVFLLLLALAAIAIFASVKVGKNSPSQSSKTPSLTSQQLAALKGSTTLVGDPQQVLDIQSNAVFEGQVLVRGNLDVAGTVKVGGPLSLSSVTVGGTSTFDKVSINTLSVASGASIQKSLAVGGAATFGGALSAPQLNVTTLQISGDLVISRHLLVSGTPPGKTNGSALGSGGTASINGTDTAGTVTVNTGGSPPTGCFVTINFAKAYGSTPHVIISPSNSSTASLSYYTNRGTTSFSVCTVSAPAASTTYLFDYIVVD